MFNFPEIGILPGPQPVVGTRKDFRGNIDQKRPILPPFLSILPPLLPFFLPLLPFVLPPVLPSFYLRPAFRLTDGQQEEGGQEEVGATAPFVRVSDWVIVLKVRLGCGRWLWSGCVGCRL